MFEIGRICIKIAGRDAGQKCVIVDTIDKDYALIDGQTRRKRCNIDHLEPLQQVISLSKNAAHEEVAKAFSDGGIPLSTSKAKAAGPKPRRQRKAAAA